LFALFTPAIDRVAGTLAVAIPSFIPANMIAAPSGTTHFKVISGGASIDFTAESYEVATPETAILPWDASATAMINLSNAVTANSLILWYWLLVWSFTNKLIGKCIR
jgi:hypothetical protein